MITLIDLRKDIKDLVKGEDFRILEKQFETVKVDNSRQISKLELDERLTVLNNEFAIKLAERPKKKELEDFK
jgi:uncharacterized small protein (DUF1192 family)